MFLNKAEVILLKKFTMSKIPKLHFGVGSLDEIGKEIIIHGNKVLLLVGGSSFQKSEFFQKTISNLKENNIIMNIENIKTEPSPLVIDNIVKKYQDMIVEVVVSIGGGSVLDAGKAVSAMLPKQGDSVKDYLEGVGSKTHDGEKLPFIAVPTTSGTGSEATKNAVISEIGENGFKKSLRHDNFIPDCAIIDPRLMINCPKSVTAASGMDAFAQLLEAYMSTTSNPLTDCLALEGLKCIKEGLIHSFNNGNDLEARGKMAYASYLSGVVLANAGLGTVHGFASPIGGLFDIPHGVVCGTLIGELVKINIRKMEKSSGKYHKYLHKYSEVGKIFSGETDLGSSASCRALEIEIDNLLDILEIPKLSKYGITELDFDKIVKDTGNKNNPINLTENEMKIMLSNRL